MTENNNHDKRSDFTSKNFIERNQHNRDIGSLKKRLEDIENRVGDDARFAQSFVSAQKNNKDIDNSIYSVIEQHDKHLLMVKGAALGKWLLVLILGAILGWVINQALSSAQYSSQIEVLRREIESFQK